jgi:hypothetical protein
LVFGETVAAGKERVAIGQQQRRAQLTRRDRREQGNVAVRIAGSRPGVCRRVIEIGLKLVGRDAVPDFVVEDVAVGQLHPRLVGALVVVDLSAA